MTRRHQHDQGTYDTELERVHVRRVACPPPKLGCGAPVGIDCVRPYRHPPRAEHTIDSTECSPAPGGCGARRGEPCAVPHGSPHSGPCCWRRVAAADAAHPEGAHPALPEPPAPPPPSRRLLPVEDVRRELAEYRVPCGWCHAPVVWATNPRHAETPVDAEPSPDGYLVLSVGTKPYRWPAREGHEIDRTVCPVPPDGCGAGYGEPCNHLGPRCHPLAQQQIPAARAHGQRLHTPHRKTCVQGGRPTWTRGVRHNRHH